MYIEGIFFLLTVFELSILWSFFSIVASSKGRFNLLRYRIVFAFLSLFLMYFGITMILANDSPPIYNTLYTIAVTLLVSSIFDLPFTERIFYIGLLMFLGQGSDIFIGLFLGRAPSGQIVIDSHFIVYSFAVQLVFFMLSKLFAYAFAKNKPKLPDSYWITFITIMLVSLLELYFIGSLIDKLGVSEQSMLAVIVMCMFLINLMVLIVFELLIRDRDKIVSLSEESLAQKYSEEKIELIMENAKKSAEKNHNYEHLILTLLEFAEYNKAEECISQILRLGEKVKKEKKLRNKIFFPHDKEANTLLNIKLEKAAEENLILETEIEISKKLPIKGQDDICLLLNNLFDNAFNACKNSDNKTIYFKAYDNDKGTFLRMENFAEDIVLNNEGLVDTSKSDDHSHGHGLRIVKKLVEENNGFFNVKFDNKTFTVSMIFMNIPSRKNISHKKNDISHKIDSPN